MILNLVILLGFLGFSGATLTLPGIAGVILTVGMGVDSNVLIFERIREELRSGKTPAAAVDRTCDKCGSARMRFVGRSPSGKSYFRCDQCEHLVTEDP